MLVISPLLSLMADQMTKLLALGIQTVTQLGEGNTVLETDPRLTHIFTSPEALLTKNRTELLLDADFVKRIIASGVARIKC